MRKEYNNRWDAPLVNPPITQGELDAEKAKEEKELEEQAKYEEWLNASGF
jgi:hypothetical protein